MLSEQTQSLMTRYGVTTRDALLRAMRDEMNTECWQPGDGPRFTIRDAELSLDPMLEAEYQRIAGGAYDEPVDEPDYVEMTYERWQSDYGVEPDPEPTTFDRLWLVDWNLSRAWDAAFDALCAATRTDDDDLPF